MNIHTLQHVPFEGLAGMEPYFLARGHQLSSTRLYLGQDLPPLSRLDWLIVMGGPMGVHDESSYPWLAAEKRMIQEAMESGKIVLGICLGAQLIADALGARVFKNEHREIGWFPVDRTEDASKTVIGEAFPETFEAFHWHGDTFEIPRGAALLASSQACRNQGFVLDNRIVGLQFHLETTPHSARALIENCSDELDGSRYVQSEMEIISVESRFSTINDIMASVLQKLEEHHS